MRRRPFRPFSRDLEFKNAKTQGRDFLTQMPSLGFRILEFEFLDSSSWIRANERPTRTSTSRVGKHRLMLRFFPFMGVTLGETLRVKCLVIAFLVTAVAFIRGSRRQ